MAILTWIGIIVCLVHSALFSGLNLGFFGLSRLRLEVEAGLRNKDAERILELRKDSHFLLTTILWGNVMSNVLLALLSESILAGLGAFIFSSLFITITAEILPQAYFSRHVLRSSIFLIPFIKFYQIVLYPIAKPAAFLLDKWLGKEVPGYFSEEAMKMLLKKHAAEGKSQISVLESRGAINFLNLDDIKVEEIGNVIHPESVISLSVSNGLPDFPDFDANFQDPFIRSLRASGKERVIITDLANNPVLVIKAANFLQDACLRKENLDIIAYCRRPFVVTKPEMSMGRVIEDYKKFSAGNADRVKAENLILLWAEANRRIITGTDLLKRLLQGIVSY